MSKLINLDALITREDFSIAEGTSTYRNTQSITISELEKSALFYSALRKPDFQRETNEWDANRVFKFIESFLEGDLIPAIILWKSAGDAIFIIDGAHRLSAMIAWVNDDYGDGKMSQDMYGNELDMEQKKNANDLRKKLEAKYLKYSDVKLATTNPGPNVEAKKVAMRISSLSFQLQWVEGDASKAEKSFFTINRSSAPINETEIQLLQSRKKPNTICARAITRSGSGHRYWSNFSSKKQEKIEEIAKKCYDLLFNPSYQTPLKTLDLPLIGKISYSQRLQLIYDIINIANNIDHSSALADDMEGDVVIRYTEQTYKMLATMNSKETYSLGLHPAIYFYSKHTGRFQPTTLMAVADFLKFLETKNGKQEFTSIREVFEKFLIENHIIINQIVTKYGSGAKSYSYISKIFHILFEGLKRKKAFPALKKIIQKDPDLSEINFNKKAKASKKKDFSANAKSAAFITSSIPKLQKCAHCGGALHVNSISIDHKQRKRAGGKGTIDNSQLMHFYCNSTDKN